MAPYNYGDRAPNMAEQAEIFVVDDDPAVRQMLTAVFAAAGEQVVCFADGAALIAATRERTPACIILDVHIPGRSGLDILKELNADDYPAPDGRLTFDKLSSVFASGNKTRDDQPNHIVIRRDVPQGVAALWERMCPAQVYEATETGVEVTPSNCVQCGAITAKGGRLTPPEGGSGPEYKLT